MLAGFEGALGIVVMGQVRRGDIDGIDSLDEDAEVVVGLESELFCKDVGLGLVGIEDGDDIGPAHDLGFRDEPAGNPTGADDPNLADILCLLTELRAGDTLGARQIDYLAVLVQIVELPHPVGPDGEDIDIILLNIVDLLPHIVLDDHLIGIACSLHGLDSFQDIVPDIEFSPPPVEAIARHPDDQIIAEFLRPSKEIDVTLVEEVVGAVGDDFYHGHYIILSSIKSMEGDYQYTIFTHLKQKASNKTSLVDKLLK